MPNRLLPVPPALPVPWLPEAAAQRCVRDHVADRLRAARCLDAWRAGISIEPGAVNRIVGGLPCHVGVDLARPGSDASIVVEVGPRGIVRAYRLDEHRTIEPLEAVMVLDDEAADRRQQEAREQAVGRLWARDRWGS